MLKQAVLKSIDEYISDIKDKSNGKVRYSIKDVTAILREIRSKVSDIETNIFPIQKHIDMNENDIMTAVCNVMGLTKEEMISNKRNAELIRARKIFSVCAKQILGYKPPQIAPLIDKNRTTVIFHLKNHEADMFSCRAYRNTYNSVCEKLGIQNTF